MNGFWLSFINLFKPPLIALLLSAIGFLASSSVFAHAHTEQRLTNWHYAVRPGDTLSSVADRALKPGRSWIDLAQHNQLKEYQLNKSQALPTGMILQIPYAWLQQQPHPARVISLTGLVLVKRREESRYRPISIREQIHSGDELLTAQGSAIIKLADASTIRLAPHSYLIFNKLSTNGKIGMVDTQMLLQRGHLKTKVTPLINGSRYEISTPSAVAAVRGTEFEISVSPTGTKLDVIEGSVSFLHEAGEELVSAGNVRQITTQTIARSANFSETEFANVTTKTKTPPLNSLNIESIHYIEGLVGIFWQHSNVASSYILQISYDEAFQSLLSEQTLSEPRAFIKLPKGAPLFARVKGIKTDTSNTGFGPYKQVMPVLPQTP